MDHSPENLSLAALLTKLTGTECAGLEKAITSYADFRIDMDRKDQAEQAYIAEVF
jgi:hypothetical protein